MRDSDLWRTYRCKCGCRDVRKVVFMRLLRCPDCGEQMYELCFTNSDWPGCGRFFMPYVEYKGKWVQTWDDVKLVDRLEENYGEFRK